MVTSLSMQHEDLTGNDRESAKVFRGESLSECNFIDNVAKPVEMFSGIIVRQRLIV